MWSDSRELEGWELERAAGRRATVEAAATAARGDCKVRVDNLCCRRRLPALEVETLTRIMLLTVVLSGWCRLIENMMVQRVCGRSEEEIGAM